MRLKKRFFVVPLTTLLLSTFTASPALADYIYAHSDVYASTAECTEAREEVSHGSGGGYVKLDTMSVAVFTTVAGGVVYCYSKFYRPAGYIATYMRFWKWTGSAWAVCTSMVDWFYNPANDWITSLAWNNGTWPPCGPGYYGTLGDRKHSGPSGTRG